MREKSSLFKKYFSIYAVTLLICTFMLGMALLYFASQYFRDENRSSLTAAAERGIEATVYNFERYGGYLVRSELEQEYALVSRATGSMLFFSDVDGRVEICSEGAACTHKTASVPPRVRELLLSAGEYFDAGDLDGFFRAEGRYTYARMVVIDGVAYGYVFASTALTGLFDFLYQVTLMFLFSSVITLAASFVIIYYATRILTRPLREISTAAVRFGSGDFSVRVTVSGHDEIGKLAQVFNDMAVSFTELEMTRRSFVANVSHELRTPMTTIAGYIDGILDGTIQREDRGRYLQIVTDEVKRLARLTSSLLDIARMEAGEQAANIVSHNAWDIVLNVMWNVERRIDEKGIVIEEMDVEPRFVLCDADMLHQVVYNLMDNAVKYTPAGGSIAVRLRDEGYWTALVIRNSGAGIDKEDVVHIFERFYKTDKSRGLDKTSTGLGLYIVKTLTARMDGHIGVRSEPGVYTEFTVRLQTGTAAVKKKPRQKQAVRQETEREKDKRLIDRLARGFRKDER